MKTILVFELHYSAGTDWKTHYLLPTLAHWPSSGTCYTLPGLRSLSHTRPLSLQRAGLLAPWRHLDFLSGERLPPAGVASVVVQSPSPTGDLEIKT